MYNLKKNWFLTNRKSWFEWTGWFPIRNSHDEASWPARKHSCYARLYHSKSTVLNDSWVCSLRRLAPLPQNIKIRVLPVKRSDPLVLFLLKIQLEQKSNPWKNQQTKKWIKIFFIHRRHHQASWDRVLLLLYYPEKLLLKALQTAHDLTISITSFLQPVLNRPGKSSIFYNEVLYTEWVLYISSSHSSSSYVIPNYYRGFLKAFPTSRTINTDELHDFARQIARGMEHLELKGITHR